MHGVLSDVKYKKTPLNLPFFFVMLSNHFFFFAFVPLWRDVRFLSNQMGTMLDPKKNSLYDFSVKDASGKVLREPVVPMLMEELKVSQSVRRFRCWPGRRRPRSHLFFFFFNAVVVYLIRTPRDEICSPYNLLHDTGYLACAVGVRCASDAELAQGTGLVL